MEDKYQVRLGAVQETLFVPIAARAAETRRKHPVVRDPKAAEMVRSIGYDEAGARQGYGRHLVPSQLPGSRWLGR